MKPRAVVEIWVEAFNRSDPDALARLYTPDAVNHQAMSERLGAPVYRRQSQMKRISDVDS